MLLRVVLISLWSQFGKKMSDPGDAQPSELVLCRNISVVNVQ